MDAKFDELVYFIQGMVAHYETSIENARKKRYPGYKMAINNCKTEIIKLENILRKAEEISGEKYIKEKTPSDTLYWDELTYDKLQSLVDEGKSDAEIGTMYNVVPETVKRKRERWHIMRTRCEKYVFDPSGKK